MSTYIKSLPSYSAPPPPNPLLGLAMQLPMEERIRKTVDAFIVPASSQQDCDAWISTLSDEAVRKVWEKASSFYHFPADHRCYSIDHLAVVWGSALTRAISLDVTDASQKALDAIGEMFARIASSREEIEKLLENRDQTIRRLPRGRQFWQKIGEEADLGHLFDRFMGTEIGDTYRSEFVQVFNNWSDKEAIRCYVERSPWKTRARLLFSNPFLRIDSPVVKAGLIDQLVTVVGEDPLKWVALIHSLIHGQMITSIYGIEEWYCQHPTNSQLFSRLLPYATCSHIVQEKCDLIPLMLRQLPAAIILPVFKALFNSKALPGRILSHLFAIKELINPDWNSAIIEEIILLWALPFVSQVAQCQKQLSEHASSPPAKKARTVVKTHSLTPVSCYADMFDCAQNRFSQDEWPLLISKERLLELAKKHLIFFYVLGLIEDLRNPESLKKWINALSPILSASPLPNWRYVDMRAGYAILEFASQQEGASTELVNLALWGRSANEWKKHFPEDVAASSTS